ncbi:hypothetical protein COO60DRAFT_1208384 [Scenedesmus sp. NREL 46B-D3]|nr:hypothetical protein COO60DRAFT_1208384 [Scenedesmus sp. NREL 46B-D3]
MLYAVPFCLGFEAASADDEIVQLLQFTGWGALHLAHSLLWCVQRQVSVVMRRLCGRMGLARNPGGNLRATYAQLRDLTGAEVERPCPAVGWAAPAACLMKGSGANTASSGVLGCLLLFWDELFWDELSWVCCRAVQRCGRRLVYLAAGSPQPVSLWMSRQQACLACCGNESELTNQPCASWHPAVRWQQALSSSSTKDHGWQPITYYCAGLGWMHGRSGMGRSMTRSMDSEPTLLGCLVEVHNCCWTCTPSSMAGVLMAQDAAHGSADGSVCWRCLLNAIEPVS